MTERRPAGAEHRPAPMVPPPRGWPTQSTGRLPRIRRSLLLPICCCGGTLPRLKAPAAGSTARWAPWTGRGASSGAWRVGGGRRTCFAVSATLAGFFSCKDATGASSAKALGPSLRLPTQAASQKTQGPRGLRRTIWAPSAPLTSELPLTDRGLPPVGADLGAPSRGVCASGCALCRFPSKLQASTSHPFFGHGRSSVTATKCEHSSPDHSFEARVLHGVRPRTLSSHLFQIYDVLQCFQLLQLINMEA